MCHVSKNTTTAVVTLAVSTTPVFGSERFNHHKSNARLSPFRKIAKSARVNLNKYWGLLSQNQQRKGSVSSSTSSMELDFSAEEEQNRINELLEAQANDEEQNSINSQIEYDSSPEPPRRLFVRQRALISSSYSSFASSSVSSASSGYSLNQSHHSHHQYPSCGYDDSISQDSVFI